MPDSNSIRPVLERHLQSILDNDIAAYHASTVSELTLYEWYVTPHRIEGLPFHDFMMIESARSDTAGTALDPVGGTSVAGEAVRQRFDLANYAEQRYGETVICSYTLLLTKGTADGVRVRSHHETRVLVRLGGEWKVVHVHKSPAWAAPYSPPG